MIWISFVVMIGTIVVSCAMLRSGRGDALGIPLIAIGSFAFLYVIQPLQLILTGSRELFLTEWQFAKALLVPAVMLGFFMWGWLHPGRRRPMATAPWDPRVMWKFGFGTACVGLILYLIFLELSGGITHSFSQVHGLGMDYNNNTAYIYDGPWLMLSGSAMMMFGDPRTKSQRWRSLAPYVFLSLNLLSAILTGGRGPLFALAATYFVTSCIAQRKKVSFGQAARVLLPVGVAVVLMAGYRNVLHLGAEPTSRGVPSAEAAYNQVAGVSEYDLDHDTVSQEFLYHAALIETVDQTGKLDYGVSWVEFLVINPIPRILWREKPTVPNIGVTWADIDEETGLNIVYGSASGIVADLYQRFHLFSTIFLFALGTGLRRLFVSARNLSSPITAVGYVMIYAVSLNMFAQGFSTIFVPFGYSMAPVVLFAWVTKRSQRKARLRRSEMTMRQAAALHSEQWSS